MGWEPLPHQRESMTDLSSTLGRLHTTLGFARPDTVALLSAQWESLLGSRLAARCELESLRGTELVIGVDDPAVAEHLRWSSTDLVAAANAVCGAEVVESVSVRIRRVVNKP